MLSLCAILCKKYAPVRNCGSRRGLFVGILEHILAQRDCRVKRISSCKTVEEMVY